MNVGDAKLALRLSAVCCAVLTGLFASEVLSALPSPTIALEIPPIVPVKVGDSKLALRLNAVCCAVLTGLFTSDVLSTLPRPTIAAVTPLTVPVKIGLLMGAFKPIWLDTVAAKLASDPIANASSFKVSNAAGALATKLLISVLTNSVVASWVVFVPVAGVGADGIPVNVGDAKFDFKSRAVCCAVETGLFTSEVLSALSSPTIALVIPLTIPVNIGDAKLALRSNAVCCAVLTGLFTSEVLSALPSPTIAFEIPPTVPVKVGDCNVA